MDVEHESPFEWDPARGRLTCEFTKETDMNAFCGAFVAAASEHEAVTLCCVCDHASPGAALSRALERRPLAAVRNLIFDNPSETVTRQNQYSPGRLDVVLTALPGLECAYVTGSGRLAGVRHKRLRNLHLLGDPLAPASVAGLGDSDLPALERLVLCLAGDHQPADSAAVAAALHKLRAPELRYLDVTGSDNLVALVDALCASPLPASWTTVSLEGSLDDEDELLAALERHAAILGRLERLALPLYDDMSEGAAARAVELVPRVIDRHDLPDLLLPAVYKTW